MKINKYHPMGDIYLFKMLILLIKMHIYVLNQKSKGVNLFFWLKLVLFGDEHRRYSTV